MAYQVLARKWRPLTFKEMAGQTHVLRTLIHALDAQRLHHAYLFTGTRGVGKTTVARILARCLNCETGVTSNPCGECGTCQEIMSGRFIDLIEVDAASRTKVEDTRELLENVQYAPSRGRYKIYLIDEVHMLSTHSFNALLKTLEEPPPHVKFLLATTDPQKLPITVLSRCLQFHLKNLVPSQVANYLQSVLTAEGIEYEEKALWMLGQAAAGSMRDALTLLDQCISFGEGVVKADAVAELLGTPDFERIYGILDALSERNGEALIAEVEQAAEQNPDFVALATLMQKILHRLALAQTVPAAVSNDDGQQERLMQLAARFSADDVQLYYQICVQLLQELVTASEKRIGFEMALLRMLAFSPDVFADAHGGGQDGGDSLKKKPESPVTAEQIGSPAEQPSPVLTETVAATQAITPDNEPNVQGVPKHNEQHEEPLSPQTAQQDVQQRDVQQKQQAEQAPQAQTASLRNTPSSSAQTSEQTSHDVTADPQVMQPYDEPPMPGSSDIPDSAYEELQSSEQPSTASEEPSASKEPSVSKELSAASEQTLTQASVPQASTETVSTPVEKIAQPAGSLSDLVDRETWYQTLQAIGMNGIAPSLLWNCVVEKVQNQRIFLLLDETQSALYSADQNSALASLLGQQLNTDCQVDVTVTAVHEETPSARRRREREEAIAALENRFQSDPGVMGLLAKFDASIEEMRIEK